MAAPERRALVEAAGRFDPDRGTSFSTFAVPCLVGALKRHFRDRGWAVRTPRQAQERWLELCGRVEELSQALGRAPTVADLAQAMGTSDAQVLDTLEVGRGLRARSLDQLDLAVDAPGLASEDPGYRAVEDRSLLGRALGRLDRRARTVVALRFGEGLTQAEIAGRVGVSQMQVSRILAQSLAELRSSLLEPTDTQAAGVRAAGVETAGI